MQIPTVLSFDCAHTLIDARWEPGHFAVTCAENVGITVHRKEDAHVYRTMLGRAWPEFCNINLSRDPEQVRVFWSAFTVEWLGAIGESPDFLQELLKEADRQMYETATWFELYSDVLPTLNHPQIQLIRKAILSNWDISLHKVVASKGIVSHFDPVIASLEEGPEKPDPALFKILLDRLGVAPWQVLHIGDNPDDDFEGAKRAGMHACLLNRTLSLAKPQVKIENGLTVATISSLTQIPEVLQCIA